MAESTDTMIESIPPTLTGAGITEPPPVEEVAQPDPTEAAGGQGAEGTEPAGGKGNFDAGLQRLQRQQAEDRRKAEEQANDLTKKVDLLMEVVTKAVGSNPQTPTGQQVQRATLGEAERQSQEILQKIDQQIADAGNDSVLVEILKTSRALAEQNIATAKRYEQQVAEVRTEAQTGIRQAQQQATVWMDFDAQFPHAKGKGPDEWEKVKVEGKAYGLDPANPEHNRILSSMLVTRMRQAAPKGAKPLSNQPDGSAPSVSTNRGVRAPQGETDEAREQRIRRERADKWDALSERALREAE